jgi:hypothetical protein
MEFSMSNPELDPDSYKGSEISLSLPSSERKYDIVFRNVVFDYQSSLGKIS